jgi:hypothetical protein
VGSYNQKQLLIVMVETFPIEMVKNGYCCGADMWPSLSTTISFSTCTFQLLWLVVEQNRLQLKIINCNRKGHL